jgi:hypothetical protein
MKVDPKLAAALGDASFDVPMRGFLATGLFKLLAANPDEVNDAIKETSANPARLRNLLEQFRSANHINEKKYTIHAPDLAALTRAAVKSLITARDDLGDMVKIPEDVPIEVRGRILAEASSVATLHEVFGGNKFHATEFGEWLKRNIATLKNLQKACLSTEHAKKAHKDATTVRRFRSKIGRNDKCPCESGQKFKKCCGSKKPESDSDAPHVVLEKEDETP